MDPRRPSRLIDPKVRRVGFFAPDPDNHPGFASSPSGNSSSPAMIPHAFDSVSQAVPVPNSTLSRPRRTSFDESEQLVVGSYNPMQSVLGTSPASSGIGVDGEFSEDSSQWVRLTDGFGLTSPAISMTELKDDQDTSGMERVNALVAETPTEVERNAKSLKEKTTKAERRALQETQRAAKASGKAGEKSVVKLHGQSGKPAKQPPQKKDGGQMMSSAAISETKGGDRPPEKDRKKDVPAPRMQFDDKNRVEKAKKRALVKKIEARNRVELFRHLPQYEQGTQLPDLESRFFHLDTMHPAVYKVGLQYLAGDVVGANARCVAMLQAFQQAIKDYSTPREKALGRDLTARISGYVSFLNECRPLSISMGNAIRFLKARITKLSLTLSESEAKAALYSDIERFMNEKIVLAGRVITRQAVMKIRDGDVLLTYGSSSVVEMILLHAYELGKQFRVIVVDSRPKFEGRALLRRLVRKGLSCTYTHINAVSYIMHEVSRVFMGAESVLSNGTVYSGIGTACVAMVAHAFRVPLLICCEAYKFHERVQLDSVCSNELGDPDVISKVPGRLDVNYLDNWTSNDNIQLLNLMYDATPSDYISMIITDYGMIPTTSVPVIVREYGREHLLI
ncbi:translation initiation factor eIF-2B subunit delta-like [Solanum tuberosum]|uniref:Translation initiation factor eIF2B subunit delta n=2 Tax=Solanum tuberosum TaxID=4113 RepID=M1C466_SOLTU|nr:PREDICTED: translation initiation factor eIF-2B subunit delta-like [Solanum tuberosum]